MLLAFALKSHSYSFYFQMDLELHSEERFEMVLLQQRVHSDFDSQSDSSLDTSEASEIETAPFSEVLTCSS